MRLTETEYRAFLRRDLCPFIEKSFYELNPTTPFLRNWHIELIAAELEACRRGDTKRLIINIPPRSLKSICASVAFPAWVLGHDPSSQIICVSYAQDLANKHAMDCRTLLSTKSYQKLFPTRLSEQRQAVQEFMTTQKGFRLATSVGGALTGRGAEFIIIDDPLKPDEALSDTQRKAVNSWYDNTLYTPLGTLQLPARADRAGSQIGALCRGMHSRDGETAVRRIQGVLSRAKKYGAASVEDACAAALEVGVCEYHFVRRYLERRPQLPLSLRQVDPLIRQLTLYRDFIENQTKEGEA